MPNTRRRKFSVQHDIAGRDPSQFQNTLQSSRPEPDLEPKFGVRNVVITTKANKSKNKIIPNNSKNVSLHILKECESNSSVTTVKRTTSARADKDVTASSSNIDLFHLLNDLPERSKTQNRYPRQSNRDAGSRRDQIPRQHRVKVRSPKRRMISPESLIQDEISSQAMGTYAIDWEQEIEVPIKTVTRLLETAEEERLETAEEERPEAAEEERPKMAEEERPETAEEERPETAEEERPSNHSLDDMCRICHGGESLSFDLGQLISACSCRGTVGRVHVKCLERWLTESGKSRCELCGTRYAIRRVHRYGVPRALVMWILSQNAKQLMVDSLGIMLMSPLAVLAAWLSGRTLAGLMTQDSHITPWPLASTFVLACMTLVCYYCWIVSAATRHALGWWIWYRSQYEVRLQFQNEE